MAVLTVPDDELELDDEELEEELELLDDDELAADDDELLEEVLLFEPPHAVMVSNKASKNRFFIIRSEKGFRAVNLIDPGNLNVESGDP